MALPSSYHKSNDHDDGPFRKVVSTEMLSTGYEAEILICGHRGRVLNGSKWDTPGKRRRCWNCKTNPKGPTE
jgi:hypothetical protein